MEFIIGELKSLDKRILSSHSYCGCARFCRLDQPFAAWLFTRRARTRRTAGDQNRFSEQKTRQKRFSGWFVFGKLFHHYLCNHRDAVERTNSILKEKGIVTVFYHGGMEQQQRDEAPCSSEMERLPSWLRLTWRHADLIFRISATSSIIIYLAAKIYFAAPQWPYSSVWKPAERLYLFTVMVRFCLEYISAHANDPLPETAVLPEKPKWSTSLLLPAKRQSQ